MPTSLSTLRLSKHGLPAALLMSEYQEGMRQEISAYLVWPEQSGAGDEVVRLVHLAMPYPPGARVPSLDEALQTMRLAADAGVIHHASKLCSKLDHPVDQVIVESLEPATLRAWRSLGLYGGLKTQNFDWQTQNFIMGGLEQPYSFRV